MQEKQPRDSKREAVTAPKQKTKAPWHRPAIAFVPLQTTASGIGSFTDGGSPSSTASPE